MTLTGNFTSPIGGVMTAGEWGAISGELTLLGTWADGILTLRVAYAETDDWYDLENNIIPCSEAELENIFQRALEMLSQDPGDLDGDGNLDASTLHF